MRYIFSVLLVHRRRSGSARSRFAVGKNWHWKAWNLWMIQRNRVMDFLKVYLIWITEIVHVVSWRHVYNACNALVDALVGTRLAFNEDVLCEEHQRLCIEECDRRLVPQNIWRRLRVYFPDAPQLPADTSSCRHCTVTEQNSPFFVTTSLYFRCVSVEPGVGRSGDGDAGESTPNWAEWFVRRQKPTKFQRLRRQYHVRGECAVRQEMETIRQVSKFPRFIIHWAI